MRIVVIGTVGIPGCYGGFESLVENITLNSSDTIKYTVFCSGTAYTSQPDMHNGADLIYLQLKANGYQSIFYDILSLIKTINIKPDAVLILGVSGCVFLPIFKLLTSSKVVTNIDGLEWKRNKWNFLIRKFLKFSERIAVKFSDTVVTDNQAITDYVLKEYGIQSTTIAYGGDHAIRSSVCKNETSDYALGICRIEPENNVDMILGAFSRLGTPLKFVGNWDNSDFGRRLKAKYVKFSNIDLIDPIYDLDKLYNLRAGCSIYLHGHSAGGTNPSLVEMMHLGCPVFSFDCSFNRYSTSNMAHYFSDEKDLVELVNNISFDDRLENGNNMKILANEKYTWAKITKQYESTYL